MARELDSEMLQRLQTSYGAMADGELLELAAKPDDLTDMANEVLRGEMARRRLHPEKPDSVAAKSQNWPDDLVTAIFAEGSGLPAMVVGSAPTLDMAVPENSGVNPGESLLGNFHDAIEVGRACGFLEGAGIDFRLEDVAKPRSGFGMFNSPPVALNLIVAKADRERAMKVLRDAMGLFPLQEVDEADPVEDDGTVSVVGCFARREDAAEMVLVLEDARIWCRVTANEEGSKEAEDAFNLEVREVELTRAGDLLEKAMGIVEE